MAAIFGAAILGLPYNLKQTGLILGSAFIIFGGFINYLSVRCLMHVSFRKKADSFADCVYQSLGGFAGRFFEYSMILHIYCSTITYQMLGKPYLLVRPLIFFENRPEFRSSDLQNHGMVQ